MALEALHPLRDFGVRSLVVHSVMVITALAAIASAFFLEGQIGLLFFVAFLNFTAGLWVSQSIHSLGNAFTDDDYEGILGVLRSSRGTG